jgi:competence protein ComEC
VRVRARDAPVFARVSPCTRVRVPAPALFLAVPFLSGAAAAILAFDRLDQGFAFLAAAAALLTLIAATASALQRDGDAACALVGLGCALAGASLGAAAALDAYRPPLLEWFERTAPTEPSAIVGVLREDASPTPAGVSLTVDVLSIGDRIAGRSPLGGVRLSVGGALAGREIDRWRAGRTIRAPAFLRRPSTYLNPGTPDERRPLARRGIVLVGSIKSAALVDVVRPGGVLSECAAAIRAWTRARIAAHMPFDARSAGVTAAVLIGDRSGLSADDERRLQEAGTYHVIAISGGNIAILAVLGLLICRTLLVSARAAAIVTAVALLFYGLVAGGAASVARAVTVAAILLAARALDHRGASLNALASAATLAVAVSPIAILDAGFILSFGATLAILLGVPLLVAPRQPPGSGMTMAVVRHLARAAGTLCAATICAELVLAPVGATLFGRVPFAGLVLNFAAIPLMTVVQIGGLVLALASPWANAVADAAAWAVHLAATGLIHSSSLVDFAPWLSASVPPPVWWLMALYYAAALGLLSTRTRWMSGWILAAAAGVLLAGPRQTSRDAMPPSRSPVRVVVLDVGQGDATVIELPGGRKLLVDTGGLAAFSSAEPENSIPTPFLPSSRPSVPSVSPSSPVPTFDVGERVVAPALRALGISRLHAFAITHGDPDHLGGARGLLRRVPATSVWEGIPVPPHAGLRALASLATAHGMTWRTVQRDDAERFSSAEVRILHPARPEWERQRVRNEDSIVIEVRIGAISIVLPGDIGREAERAILPTLEPDRLTILKAPHHGSATSSTKEFLETTRPAAVIFSCGRENRFGHPHPAVVARYREIGAEIFSTAQDGAVFVETDGTTVEVWGWRGKRAAFTAARRH